MNNMNDAQENFRGAELVEIAEWMAGEKAREALEPAIPSVHQAKVTKSSSQKGNYRVEVDGVGLPAPEIDFGEVNWVGTLLEYRQAHPPIDTTVCKEETVGRAPERFRCTITIAETSQVFGSTTFTFANKKDAKKYACKEAVEWLVANNYALSFDQTNAKKPATPQNGTEPKTSILGVRKQDLHVDRKPTFARQVADLSTYIGLNQPSYVVEAVSLGSSIYSGYAHFNDDPRITGKIGEFRNVFGRKAAKEQCAREVLIVLEGIRDQRLKSIAANNDGTDAEVELIGVRDGLIEDAEMDDEAYETANEDV